MLAAGRSSRTARRAANGPAAAGRLRSMLRVGAALIACSLTSLASGQTVVNPGFDTDLTGWSVWTYHSWSPEDCHGSATSGSLLATKEYASSSLLNAEQCFDVTPGQHLSLDVKYLVPSTSEDAEIWISVSYWAQPGCTDLIDFSQRGPFTVKGSWATAWVPPFEAPAGAVAGEVHLGVIEADNGVVPVAAHFDDAVLDVAIFADGFESSSTSAWSGAVP